MDVGECRKRMGEPEVVVVVVLLHLVAVGQWARLVCDGNRCALQCPSPIYASADEPSVFS